MKYYSKNTQSGVDTEVSWSNMPEKAVGYLVTMKVGEIVSWAG